MTDPIPPYEPLPSRNVLREDIAACAVASAVAVAVGVVLIIPSALILIPGWLTLAYAAWMIAALALLPWLALAWLHLENVNDRHALDRERNAAERRLLVGKWLDTNRNGQVEDTEMAAFLRYVRALYDGKPTTAAQAQDLNVPGPVWQKYRNVLITIGLARRIRKRGGDGFDLHRGVYKLPWQQIEAHIRERAGLLVRTEPGPDMVIMSSPRAPQTKDLIDAVSTLGRD